MSHELTALDMVARIKAATAAADDDAADRAGIDLVLFTATNIARIADALSGSTSAPPAAD